MIERFRAEEPEKPESHSVGETLRAIIDVFMDNESDSMGYTSHGYMRRSITFEDTGVIMERMQLASDDFRMYSTSLETIIHHDPDLGSRRVHTVKYNVGSSNDLIAVEEREKNELWNREKAAWEEIITKHPQTSLEQQKSQFRQANDEDLMLLATILKQYIEGETE